MSALTSRSVAGSLNPLGLLLTIVTGLAVALAIVAAGANAFAGLVGVIFFILFLRNPVFGLYVTSALLLLAGMSFYLAGTRIGLPSSAAKLAGAATIAAWLLNAFATGRRLRIGREVVVVILFAAWALLGVSLSLNWREQLPEWRRLGIVIAYFVMAIHLLDTRDRIHRFVTLILLCGFAMSLFAIAQYLIPGMQSSGVAAIQAIGQGEDLAFIDPEGTTSTAAVRVTGGMGHSNWLAFALLLILPLNVYWYATTESARGRAFVVFVVLCELAALVLTFTRLGLVVGLIVAAVLVIRRMVRLSPHRLAALAVALLICWFLLPQAYKERVIDFTQYADSQSTSARVELQTYAWEYMTTWPTSGIGLGGFGLYFYEENSPVAAMLRWMNDTFGWNPLYYGPHNMYLQLGCETGVVGLLIMLYFFYRSIANAQIAEKRFQSTGDANLALLASTVTVSILAFLFCAVFLHALHQKVWWMIMALATALAFYALNLPKPAKGKSAEPGARGR